MAGNKKRKVKSRLHRFYFLRPRENANIDELADILMDLKPIEEVFVSGHRKGFLVKAKLFNSEEIQDVINYITKNIDNKYGKVVCNKTAVDVDRINS